MWLLESVRKWSVTIKLGQLEFYLHSAPSVGFCTPVHGHRVGLGNLVVVDHRPWKRSKAGLPGTPTRCRPVLPSAHSATIYGVCFAAPLFPAWWGTWQGSLWHRWMWALTHPLTHSFIHLQGSEILLKPFLKNIVHVYMCVG